MNALLLLACALGCIVLTTGQDQAVPPEQQGVAAEVGLSEENSRRLRGPVYRPQPVRPQNPSVYYNLGLSTQAAYPAPQNQGQNQQQNVVAPALSAVDASRQLIAAAIQQGANPNNFGKQTNAHYQIANQANPQIPPVWDALDALRGRAALTIEEILNILANAVPGRDYPVYNDIPSTRFSCENVKQAGFYADTDAQCQVIRRCDINGVEWAYLCPNMTLFNQVTLVCDWFFNVNCNNAINYYDYSNPRLYTQFVLLDTPKSGPVVVGPGPIRGTIRPEPNTYRTY